MKNEKSKFTLGPWHMDYHTSIFAQCPAVYSKDNKLVANVLYGNTDDSAKEAAFLIAAAPELLAALELALTTLSSVACNESDEIDNVKTEIANAINKAKGE